MNSASDWPESVCDALVNFEREEGTLETWESAVRRTEAQMKRVTEQREKVCDEIVIFFMKCHILVCLCGRH